MGCFSWMFADEQNQQNLCTGKRAYIFCPDNSIITEPAYDGVGIFGGKDIYELVADWNRKYLSEHPDFMIPVGSDETYDPNLQIYISQRKKKISECPWYPFYANLSLTPNEVARKWAESANNQAGTEYRLIGIDIACYSSQNAALPFPIKVCKRKTGHTYATLPASESDPYDGARSYKREMPTAMKKTPMTQPEFLSQEDIRVYVQNKRKEISDLYAQKRKFMDETPVVPDGYIADEEKSVRWNREEVTRRNNSRKGKIASYKAKISKCETDIAEKIQEYIKASYNFGSTTAKIIYDAAYEEGHSAGYEEVISCAEKYADFAEQIINTIE